MNRTCRPLFAALGAVVATAATVAGAQSIDLDGVLGFEGSQGALPEGWGGGPRETMAVVADVVHGGNQAGRIARTTTSEGDFTSFTYSLPLDLAGETLELRGWLRTEGVTSGAALWLREDGPSGPVAFDNMANRPVGGTTEWSEYRIELPLEPSARTAFFGFLLIGAGTVWGDDLRLLVDGRPIAEAPKREIELTAIDLDREFQAGSRVEIGTLTRQQIESLTLLGKVWGFLKYHHPRVTGGERHWDFELFRALPSVLAATDGVQARSAIFKWASERVGPAPDCAPCETLDRDDLHLEPRIDWIRDPDQIGPELAAYLQQVHRRRSAGLGQFYVSRAPAGNAQFDNESYYEAARLGDAGFRILTLFRIWNMVEYWFPYRDQVVGDWDQALADFLPPVAEAADREQLVLALLPLFSRIADTHASIWNGLDAQPPRGDCLLPLGLRYVEDRVVVHLVPDWVPVDLALVRVGDVVARIDGRSVDELLVETAPYYPASNEPTRRLHQARWLGRGACKAASLLLERDGKPIELAIERVPLGDLQLLPIWRHDRDGEAFQRLSDDVAYLKMSAAKVVDIGSYIDNAAGAKGLVIDLRNYPSTPSPFELGGHLVDEPTEFSRGTFPDLANPGAFRWGQPVEFAPRAPRFEGRVVVMVDEYTLSAAEYHAMAFRAAPGAVVVGSTTSAADGNVSPMNLPGGLITGISGIGIFYPDRRPTQRVGIVPDVVAAPTIAGLRAGRDEVLEEAIRQIVGDAADEMAVQRTASRQVLRECSAGLQPRMACPGPALQVAPVMTASDRRELLCAAGLAPRDFCDGRW